MSGCTLAVIGHVDHGKTSLVRALTGIETDRLAEEKTRGMSIVPGFAHRAYPSGLIDFIDTPGHEDFIRAMVAGASGARAALLVVSGPEGIARQTREHLEIAGLLGITRGVVAVTKADLLAPGQREQQLQAIGGFLATTCLNGAPLIACSAQTGEGLEELGCELDRLAQRAGAPAALPGFFLPADRVFTIPGRGTVLTGSLLGGRLAEGDEAVLEPSGRRVAVRGLEAHGGRLASADPGGRIAVNLRGVTREEAGPGDVLCAPGCFTPAAELDVRLTLLKQETRALAHMEAVRVMLGAGSATARVRLFAGGRIEPGGSGYARLVFAAPVLAFAGQRAILRQLSPPMTLGGAIIIDPAAPPARRKDKGRLDLLDAAWRQDMPAIIASLSERGGGVIALAEVARLTALSPGEVRARLSGSCLEITDGRLARRDTVEAARQACLDQLAAFHAEAPLEPHCPQAQLHRLVAGAFGPPLLSPPLLSHVVRLLVSEGLMVRHGGGLRLAGHDILGMLLPHERSQLEALEEALRAGGLAPPEPHHACAGMGLTDERIKLLASALVASGRAYCLVNHALRQVLVLHVDAINAAEQALREAFPHSCEFRTGEAREALKTSRKYIVPLLEHFDACGITVRSGDLRRFTPGPDEEASA